MKKIVVWAKDDLQIKILKEFSDLDTIIIFTRSFINFKEEVTDTSVNIISYSNFNDYDTAEEFLNQIKKFFSINKNKTFRIFECLENSEASSCCGFLAQEKNVIYHMVFPDYKGTIQARIDANL